MKLYEMSRTVVYLETQEEYDEYMKMCEDVGWKWVNGQLPSSKNYFVYHEDVCVTIESELTYCPKRYYERERYTIITFTELLGKLNPITRETKSHS